MIIKKRLALFSGLLIIIAIVFIALSFALVRKKKPHPTTHGVQFSCTLYGTDLFLKETSYFLDPIIKWKDTIKVKSKLLYDLSSIVSKDSIISSAKINGSNIVWLEECKNEKGIYTGLNDVILYNIKTGLKEDITSCPSDRIRNNLIIYKNYCAWDEVEIDGIVKKTKVYNLKDRSNLELGDLYISCKDPDIYKDELVCIKQEVQDYNLSMECNIAVNNLKKGTEESIAKRKNASGPRINKNWVIWKERNTRLFAFNRKSKNIIKILLPDYINLKDIVLHKDKNILLIIGNTLTKEKDRVTFIYDLDKGKWSKIVTDKPMYFTPSISGNAIYWAVDKELYTGRIKL